MTNAVRTPLRVLGSALGLATGVHVATPAPAAAHLVSTGLGPFHDGVGHLFLTPQDLVPLVGLALLAGLSGPAAARTLFFTLPVAWLAGGIVGLGATLEVTMPLVSAATILLVGGLVLVDREPGARAVAGVGGAVALLHGWMNGTAMSASGLGWPGLLGIALGALVLVAVVAALAVSCRGGWRRIAVRAAGSWIVAAGILMLGWELR